MDKESIPKFPVTVHVEAFRMPNYMRIVNLPASDMMDVGHLFPTDADADAFWDSMKLKWLQHVAERRINLSAGNGNGS
jgi:hypothetical protein